MGKKGYNWRARQVVDTVIDNTATKKIKVEIAGDGKYDDSNALVLPSVKRKTKIKSKKEQNTRILSKAQRKRLEKVVEKKRKKENRATLLEALAKVQAPPDELVKLTSIATVQTKGLKRILNEGNERKRPHPNNVAANSFKPNSISGSKRKRLLVENDLKSDDPNVVGVEPSESEDSDEEDDRALTEETKDAKIDLTKDETNETKDAETNKTKDTETDETKDMIIDETKNIATADDKPNKKEVSKEVKLSVRTPAVFIPVDRDPEIQEARLKLPILAEEQQIMETINENPIVVVAGETGSGKTTQVPQFLYEAGYARTRMIAITEPRRVAAISMSKRVAEEMNLSQNEVSYLIRFEGNVSDETKIKFMTDGVLLKEVQTDFLLSKYSVVILDEAHERSVHTDILIGLLSRIVPLRHKRGDPLKLIVMSATLRLEDFTENRRLFKVAPPVIKVDARQFPVTVHFNKRTASDYVKEAFNKAVKIHTKLPDGGILIFVTGQQEVNTLVRRLRKAFPLKRLNKKGLSKKSGEDVKEDDSDSDEERLKESLKIKKKEKKTLPDIDLDDYAIAEEADGSDVESESDQEATILTGAEPMWVLPLYSLLPSHKQAKVFAPTPPGCRLCVVSTNIAETSLTIPGVKYVVDTGRTKVRLYDKTTGVTTHEVCFTSKASADQRAGRAGRLGPGHCYRLYSSAVFNDTFAKFAEPEIQRKPVDDLYLQMKCMNIDKIVNFPFPSAPDLLQLKSAESRLQVLGALKDGKVTQLGRAMAQFPVLPRFGKMLALSHQQDLMAYTVCMVAALSVQEVLLETPITARSPEEAKEVRTRWAATRRRWAGTGESLLLGDPMVLLCAVGSAEYANSQGDLVAYCEENGLRHKAVTEIRKLRLQLTDEIRANVPDCDVTVDPQLKPPNELQAKLLRQILLAGLGDNVARKVPADAIKDDADKIKLKYAYHTPEMEEPVFLHSSSVLRKTLPEFVVYQEIYETNKMFMRGVTAIQPQWLPVYVPAKCNISDPLLTPEPRYDPVTGKMHCTVTGTFGRQAWQLPAVEIEFPKTADCYRWFARYFLQGEVCSKLKKYVGSLLSTPSTMVRSWARLQPRTEALLKALMSRQACNRTTLEEVWSKEPKYLLQQYQGWLPESAHNEVALIWPPI